MSVAHALLAQRASDKSDLVGNWVDIETSKISPDASGNRLEMIAVGKDYSREIPYSPVFQRISPSNGITFSFWIERSFFNGVSIEWWDKFEGGLSFSSGEFPSPYILENKKYPNSSLWFDYDSQRYGPMNVAFVIWGTRAWLFLNGRPVKASNVSDTFTMPPPGPITGPISLGAVSSFFYNFRIYDRPLAWEEINTLFLDRSSLKN